MIDKQVSIRDIFYRTKVPVFDVIGLPDKRYVRAGLPDWKNSGRTVGFPLDLIPPEIRGQIQDGIVLLAEVNLGVKRMRDLRYRNFTLLPEDRIDAIEQTLREMRQSFGVSEEVSG